MNAMGLVAPNCGNCPHFLPPKVAPEGVAPQTVHVYGDCRRYPRKEPKRPEECCGEHPVVMQRIAAQLMQANTAPAKRGN